MEKLKALFDNLGVYYENISDKEIRVVCPFIKWQSSNQRKITTKDTALVNYRVPDDKYTSITDEGIILIKEDDEGYLNWLGVV